MRLKRIFTSFKNASRGAAYVFKHEQNFRIQIYAAILALLLVWFLGLTKTETIVILLLIVLVLILELLNSALEKFADVLKPRLSYHIRTVKDIMAAAVLVASLAALTIGVIVFWPYIK